MDEITPEIQKLIDFQLELQNKLGLSESDAALLMPLCFTFNSQIDYWIQELSVWVKYGCPAFKIHQLLKLGEGELPQMTTYAFKIYEMEDWHVLSRDIIEAWR